MSGSTRPSLPRSAKRSTAYSDDAVWVPQQQSDNKIFNLINRLDLQSFMNATLSTADNLLLPCLCGPKNKLERWNSLRLAMASGSPVELDTRDKEVAKQLLAASKDCYPLTHQDDSGADLEEIVNECFKKLLKHTIFQRDLPNWKPALKQ
ncbi:hypothetical protein PENSPDRAFT_690436 [Peniophora sp. CONT]|nr:hypothetical protein PENSPDRAFT_690436 [Peniophora sp. CONT]